MEYSYETETNLSLNLSNITIIFRDLSDTENIIIAWSTASTLLALFFLCILFNSLSISSIIWSNIFSPINILIMNLAVSDMIYSFSILIFLFHILNISWIFNTITCKLFYLTDTVGMIVGVFTVSALSIERFIEVSDKKKKSYRYSGQFKIFITLIYIILLWISAIIFSLPLVFSISVFKFKKIVICKSSWELGEENNIIRKYFITKFILFFLFPYSLISVSSIRLLLFLNRWKKFFPVKSGKNVSGNNKIKFKQNNDKIILSNLRKSKNNSNNDNIESINLTRSISYRPTTSTKLTSIKSSCVFIKCTNPKSNAQSVLDTNNNFSDDCESTSQSSNKKIMEKTNIKITGIPSQQKLEILSICKRRSLGNIGKKHTPRKKLNQRDAIRRKAIILVQMIVLLFFIQWIPLWLFQLVIEFSEKSIKHAEKINLVTTILSYSNTVSNPVLYMFFTYNFKDFFRQIFKKK